MSIFVGVEKVLLSLTLMESSPAIPPKLSNQDPKTELHKYIYVHFNQLKYVHVSLLGQTESKLDIFSFDWHCNVLLYTMLN